MILELFNLLSKRLPAGGYFGEISPAFGRYRAVPREKRDLISVADKRPDGSHRCKLGTSSRTEAAQRIPL
jgi:hypothetical protein